ncbi:hypothetical protein [Lelliottia amnigena]|jgi:hypothetical protein|uniref:hypothetical protein n=1 Tax=Lelliottia amnigena TaxID=61646 RepID=UPI00115783E1
MQIKIIHCSFPYVGEKRGGVDGCLMLPIVAIEGTPLNAHSCRCLAHFYRGLEKMRKGAQTGNNGNRIGSKPE